MSTNIGKMAEDLAAEHLEGLGIKVLSRNWKTRWCEIDIVAKHANRIHFVEVKFRRSSSAGSGLDYITKAKAKQMEFAALAWVGEHEWNGDYQLDVIAVDGLAKPKITYIDNAVGF